MTQSFVRQYSKCQSGLGRSVTQPRGFSYTSCSSHPIHSLQFTLGNQALQRLLKPRDPVTGFRYGAQTSPLVQTAAPVVQKQPMDPRHARGYAGEQGMGFTLYRMEDGWVFVRGPSGSRGHGVTTSGEDGLAYNVRTKELHIIDNKSLARRGNVGSATAIDPQKNLLQNLDDMIRHVESQSPESLMNNRQRILRMLRQTRAAVKKGGQIPGRVKLVVTNEGGRSTGVTRRLARQGVIFRDAGGPTDVPGTRMPLQEPGGRNTPAPSSPPTPASPSPPVTVSAPETVKPASPAMVKQQARVMAALENQVASSARQAARARMFANSVGALLEGLAVINSVSDALSIAAHGTTMPEVERQADKVVSQSQAAVSFAESVESNTSLLDALASVNDAMKRGDGETLMDLSSAYSDFEYEIQPIGEKYQDLANQLEARSKGLDIMSDLMWKAAHVPSGITTAGQASALAMHISLQRLSGRLNTAAKNYRKASESLLYRSEFIGGLGHKANRESWRLGLEAIKKAYQERMRELDAQKRRQKAAQQSAQPPPQRPKPKPSLSLWERGQRALRQARSVLRKGEGASYEEKKAASDGLWAVVGAIEQKQMAGFAHAEEEAGLRDLKGQLLKEITRMMDAGP